MNTGKDLTEVRSPQRKLAPNIVGSEICEPTSLRGIAIKAQTNKRHRFRDLYRCLDAELLYYAWQSLNKSAASGVDRVTAQEYEKELHTNIQQLVERLKTKRYRAKLVRRVYIPKENGKQRPLGIPALEDRLVQLACAKVLTAIYEQDFLDSSYGYRAGRSAHDAVTKLTDELQFGPCHYLVEADIRGFFDHMDLNLSSFNALGFVQYLIYQSEVACLGCDKQKFYGSLISKENASKKYNEHKKSIKELMMSIEDSLRAIWGMRR